VYQTVSGSSLRWSPVSRPAALRTATRRPALPAALLAALPAALLLAAPVGTLGS
jgi:hypothetical protein